MRRPTATQCHDCSFLYAKMARKREMKKTCDEEVVGQTVGWVCIPGQDRDMRARSPEPQQSAQQLCSEA